MWWLAVAALAAQVPAQDRIVLLISIDGFPGYALEDPRLPVPTLRRLGREGAVARGMRPSNPTVTWPNHTSMVTGMPPAKHGVLFNGLLVRQGPAAPVKVEEWRDKSELVHVPTVYDLAHQAGLTTAQVDWVAIQNASTITWEFAEIPRAQGQIEQEMMAEGLAQSNDLAEFSKGNPVWRDRYWTRAAAHIIRRHKPNLLLFHLLNLDSVHHRYGPKTLAGYTGMAFADDRVKDILEALRGAGLLDRATLLIVSDHGFKSVRRTVRPNALLRQQGLLRTEGAKIVCDAYGISEGGIAMVYVTDPGKREHLIPRLKEIFGAAEGVARVLEAGDFPALGMPTPQDSSQMADLVLAAKDGYRFDGGPEGEPVTDVAEGGSHGYLSTDPEMTAIFLAWGYGVRPGQRLDYVDNVDVAPTIATLLGLKMEGVAGRNLLQ